MEVKLPINAAPNQKNAAPIRGHAGTTWQFTLSRHLRLHLSKIRELLEHLDYIVFTNDLQ